MTLNKKSITIKEVSIKAGVSTATVSRVLSGANRVRPQTAAAVHQAIAELGWKPDPAAQKMALLLGTYRKK